MASKEVNEQVKPVILHDEENKRDYTLEFDRETVLFAEARGFKIEDVADYSMTKVPELFFYAFRMHHKNVSREKTDRILFDDLGGMPSGLLERLIQLYSAPYDALVNKQGEAKNSKMTVEL